MLLTFNITHHTTNLLLRPLRASDSERLFALYADVRVMEWRGAPVFTTADKPSNCSLAGANSKLKEINKSTVTEDF
ncbi:MAG: GNAT family N-acetyltransferase [Bacteroidota bacterium]